MTAINRSTIYASFFGAELHWQKKEHFSIKLSAILEGDSVCCHTPPVQFSG
jgi:hypothetical protein